MKLPTNIRNSITDHAEQAYPEECCGVIFSRPDQSDSLIRVRRCTNAQDTFHAMDPAGFPRTNRNAYFVDPKDLLDIERECLTRNEQVRLIYHSHPDAGAYFSDEDQHQAIVNDQPLHPGVGYLVVSVKDGHAGEMKLFEWAEGSGIFVCNGRFLDG